MFIPKIKTKAVAFDIADYVYSLPYLCTISLKCPRFNHSKMNIVTSKASFINRILIFPMVKRHRNEG